MKPTHRLILIVFIVQLVFYGSIFYTFETISTTGAPNRYNVVITPLIFTIILTWLLFSTYKSRVRKKGVVKLNNKNLLVGARSELNFKKNKNQFFKEIKEDHFFRDCHFIEKNMSIEVVVFYPFGLKEYILVDFENEVISLCSKPNFFQIYGPFGTGIRKMGYVEYMVEEEPLDI
ncbi:MAG: hypothetical protein ACQESK_07410 [Bacteroidota bacterium]